MGNKVHHALVDEDYVLSAGETYTIKYDTALTKGSSLLRVKRRCQDKTLKRIKLFIPFMDMSMIRQRINEVKKLPLTEKDKQTILQILERKEWCTNKELERNYQQWKLTGHLEGLYS